MVAPVLDSAIRAALEFNVITIAVLAVGAIVTLGFAPWIAGRLARVAAFVLRVSDRPNITFGALRPDASTNPHPAYQTWHHLACVNVGQTGWRARLVRTKDARESRVSITFKPSSGDAPSKTDDGIFTLGATSERITTLFVDKPVAIPVYWVADSKRNIFASERGHASHPGYYMTGETFIYHRNLRTNWKLEPDIYRLTVTVTWEGRPYEYSQELVIPDLTSGTVAPDPNVGRVERLAEFYNEGKRLLLYEPDSAWPATPAELGGAIKSDIIADAFKDWDHPLQQFIYENYGLAKSTIYGNTGFPKGDGTLFDVIRARLAYLATMLDAADE